MTCSKVKFYTCWLLVRQAREFGVDPDGTHRKPLIVGRYCRCFPRSFLPPSTGAKRTIRPGILPAVRITYGMDFLKSAVASIAKGPAFGYSFGERVDIDQSIWTLHNGTKRVWIEADARSGCAFRQDKDLTAYRKMAPSAASSPSTSTPTGHACHSRRMP